MNKNNLIKFEIQKAQSVLKDPFKYLGLVNQHDWSSICPIFIISTGRTGTHFFTHYFNNNFNNIYAVHEPEKDVFDLNNSFLKNEITQRRAGKMYKEFRSEIYTYLKDNGITNYVESNNNLSYLIPVLRNEFKNYKIIYIKRDGRDTVRSMFSKTTKGKWVGEVPIISDKDPRNRLKPTFLKNDPYADKWDKMDRFEKICWVWSRKDGLIYDQVINDNNAAIFRFEDLFVNKQSSEWNKMIDFLGLSDNLINEDHIAYIKKKKSNQTKMYELPKWNEWTKDRQRQFLNIAGEHMFKLGYAIE